MVKAAGARGAARTSVWLAGRERRGGRGGGQPSGLDRERITAATVRLLDADGLSGFSMRRLAAELNVTAMSVYWYVDTKDDLLELALDAAFAELRLPEAEAGADWREEVRSLAAEYRAQLVRHPWVSPLYGRYLNIGPNHLAFSRAVMGVIGRTGLPEHRVAGAIAAVFQFVYGYGTIEGQFLSRFADSGMSVDDFHRQAMREALEHRTAADVMRRSKEISDARGGDTVAEMLDRDFAFALDLLVAGIEAMVARGG
ncbi:MULTISPECIES: TetR/AcrR family transcriptional regulator [unclassified Streptomyces]|uniref:TetR/AcrR family transcriptional regulator n=1 Tax=unclassified Streptomyces TaxID=2593676 RepID=UPI000365E2B8|nr:MULTISPECIES: TetR/AcrR family transcriptional regulator [unclassified Streptomyces]EYT79902.1 TetR family transcriptional regulator [Streptomyces sp. Tu 6176]